MMPLTVEDGTGLENANAYLSESDTETRLTDLGYSLFSSLSPSQKTIAALRGTKRLDNALATNLKGEPTNCDQSLVYPRCCFRIRDKWYTVSSIPEDVLELAALYSEKSAYQITTRTRDALTRAPLGIKKLELHGQKVEVLPGTVLTTRDESELDSEIATLLNMVIS